ncbi:MFS transporter [Nonomuraea sp. NBC_01738]|uniref:MFS transporter n=1 Tax=Nonomuraea sp. NBC_01738 TaxID=2976003 RepID=UPI002E15EDA8|nr:MFS transporter [Nonomuraea sp. NBC_01738]
MSFSNAQVGFVGAIPYLLGAVAMVLITRSSDRTGERRWHYAGSLLTMAAGLVGTALTLGTPVVALTFLAIVGIGAYGSLGTFWPLPTTLLTGTAAATGIAVINSVGNIGGFAGPYLVGTLADATGAFEYGLLILAVLAAIGALIFLAVTRRR